MRWIVSISRRAWRQLTSMRTALVLLFLLAVAAIPGSVLPQRNVSPEKVRQYLQDNTEWGPTLDRFFFFDVYASPWFSAIYLLLFTSLVGCLVPRFRSHLVAMLRKPPAAPARFSRLPASAEDLPAAPAADVVAALRRRRFRTVVRTPSDGVTEISAEKGYLKETGNLVFHFALLSLLIGVAYGSWFGWHGNRLLIQGQDFAFCNTLLNYDEHALGAQVGEGDLPRFCLRMDKFAATYLDNGQPVTYKADITATQHGRSSTHVLQVNDPLRLDGANVSLLGHGYAPVLRYTDKYGKTHENVSAFLPKDGMLTSDGVATFPDVNLNPSTGTRDEKSQIGFSGVYLPTLPSDPSVSSSAFPAEKDPRLMLQPYRGVLGFDAGAPLSVYTLDQRQIDAKRLSKFGEPFMLKPGEKGTLPDGTTVEFVRTEQWISISIRHDPGQPIVLVGASALLVGLLGSLTGKRRRVFFRITPTGMSAGGLPRGDYPGFAEEFAAIVAAVTPAAPVPSQMAQTDVKEVV
ncbi:cytochrome c biogenesis protein ResB [Dactylosporangium aurantiacum]|uniref:cytochrome c biogenesis protein ResB n=1 Tax=Dactylosporangium aurantiacum TaxID=35754 RepID=UPI000694132D|nr:cytochrome c biogenesis protein ResB [Dactylosporangium aurantiacum]MDG6101108.1 cytochrome c biogenesis protein ResB [Dactylosporangium aurantiacum]